MSRASIEKSELSKVQHRRVMTLFLTAFLAAGLISITKSAGAVEGPLHEGVEAVGIALLAICIAGRAWCTLYLGGRKAAELVVHGPYSLSRNPLYMFSFIGAAGLGAQSGSITIAIAVAAMTVLIFRPVIIKEEAALHRIFGERYAWYCRYHPRFGPKFLAWNDRTTLEIKPSAVYRTIRDGLPFLLAIPALETVDHLQMIGILPTIFSVY